jgi:hypothetical protein
MAQANHSLSQIQARIITGSFVLAMQRALAPAARLDLAFDEFTRIRRLEVDAAIALLCCRDLSAGKSMRRALVLGNNRLVGSSSPPSPTTQSRANRDFPARCE